MRIISGLVFALLVWSAYILVVSSIFLSGLKIARNREFSGKARVGFRRTENYRITGKQAVLLGKAYMLAAVFFGLALIIGTVGTILSAIFMGAEQIVGGLATGGCCLGILALIVGNLISFTNIEYLEEDA